MTTFAILRGESMFKAELSDLYGVQVQTPDDPHPIYVMMMQISTGKTNQDLKLFGRAARHKNPLLGPVGALAFYLLYRFSQTGEFESIDDFAKNDSWFDTKLLVDLQQRTNDLNRVISDKTYSDAVKKICKQLGIPTQHYVHLGRVLGSVLAEADGDDNELIRILGNWDPKIQEKAYSSKLPMKIIRSRAGFRSNGGVHYNARTIVQPPNELLSQVFPWVDRATQELNAFLQSSPAEARPTAAVFLDFMMKLKVVVLQDAAATMVLHPERSVHQLFQLDVFKSDCFKAYVEQMRQQLAVAEDPSDVTLQAVIPPVVDRLNVLSQQGEQNCQATNEVSNQIRTGFDSVHVGHDLILQSIRSLALLINQILQLLQGTEKRSTAIMIGLNAASDYIQRTEHPSHCLPPLNNAVSPQHIINNSNPPSQLPAVSPQHIINNSNPPSQLPRPNEPSILPQGFGHKLSYSHNSIKDLYNEWYGLDRFKDVPVAGGIQAMDNSGRTLLEVSEEFEEAFAKHCKKKISNLVEWLDSNSYRRPKKRQARELGGSISENNLVALQPT
ncbi:centromere DNA-binding like protein [Nitzschia inconspicua]|uniref:Centromere DNA-binding like protein n=1 Tax=Nitzschia inconspicua TaxID=303405 RepID=A0A9K3L6P2_9STRA|nr:centromere DNA-binding like protein [Nitzschia inconspicua]KAG7356543.1 centromere DNA-binding like protein [Nitzschia inconspicua]